MSCDAVRDILSAALDNEADDVELRDARAHVQTCAACAAWEAGAVVLHRRVRLTEADHVPDLTMAISRSIRNEVRTRRPSLTPAACLILGVLAFAELLGAIPHLLAPPAALGVHAGREQAAYEIALASGFLYAALRPRMASGVAVLSTVFASLLVITTGVDVVDGQVLLGLEAHHLVAILGTVLTWAVARGVTQMKASKLWAAA